MERLLPAALRTLVFAALLAWFAAAWTATGGLRELGTLMLLGAPWMVVVAWGLAGVRKRQPQHALVALGLLLIALFALFV